MPDQTQGPIGIDYTAAYEQGGGIGRYTRELVQALARVDQTRKYGLFVAGVANDRSLPAVPGSNFHWHPTRLTPHWLARLWHRAQIPIPVEMWTGNIDLYHATDFVLPPTRANTKTIVTVHDLSFVHVPETASPSLKQYLDRVVPRSTAKADYVLADSQATKNDLVELYGIDETKIEVLLCGVGPEFHPIDDLSIRANVRNKYGLGSWPYLFTVGTVQPRKNYARLCEVLSNLRETHPDLHLVIAGGKGWLDDPIYKAVVELGLTDYVHFIGFVDDTDLPALYSMAEVVPYVSLYEGFGLVVLEAMACNTPVVASNTSSIPEVAGDAALLVDPYQVLQISDAVDSILKSPAQQQQLRTSGRKQAAQFTWGNSAKHLLAIYEKVLAFK